MLTDELFRKSDAQVLASVDVNLGGIVGLSTQCLLVDASLDLGLTAIQNAISAAAQVELVSALILSLVVN